MNTTNTAQFTPGPWVVTEHSAGMICVAGPNNKDLCAVGYNRTEGRNDVANANLIAAAPAMYEALSELVKYLREEVADEALDTWMPVFKAAMALAQAEGRQA